MQVRIKLCLKIMPQVKLLQDFRVESNKSDNQNYMMIFHLSYSVIPKSYFDIFWFNVITAGFIETNDIPQSSQFL